MGERNQVFQSILSWLGATTDAGIGKVLQAHSNSSVGIQRRGHTKHNQAVHESEYNDVMMMIFEK